MSLNWSSKSNKDYKKLQHYTSKVILVTGNSHYTWMVAFQEMPHIMKMHKHNTCTLKKKNILYPLKLPPN